MDKKRYPTTLVVSPQVSVQEKEMVCKNLYQYNVAHTASLLEKPGKPIDLVLKDQQGQVFGGIFCETFLYCLYIDVMWIDESCRGYGYGKALIFEAEKIAREYGCTFAHTCTFSYQSPEFYKQAGYEIFAVINDYPDGIEQYFLKKKL